MGTFATPVATTQEWYSRIQRELPSFLRAAWAQEIIEGFGRVGVSSADEITADVLTQVAANQRMTVEALLDSMKQCPFGFNVTSMFK